MNFNNHNKLPIIKIKLERISIIKGNQKHKINMMIINYLLLILLINNTILIIIIVLIHFYINKAFHKMILYLYITHYKLIILIKSNRQFMYTYINNK